MHIPGSDSEPESQSWSPTNKCREVLPEWQFDAGFQLFYLGISYIYIYICIYIYIMYMYKLKIYIYILYVYVYIWYTLSVCELKPSGRRRMPQESGPNEPAERWFFLCPCWSDPPPWKPHPWHGRWKAHGDATWRYHGYITNDDANVGNGLEGHFQ